MKLLELYNDLLSTGDLYEMYHNMSGVWDEDKKSFRRQQQDLESFTKNLDVYGEFTD